MVGSRWRYLFFLRRRPRAPRAIAAGAAIVLGHLALLLILNRSASPPVPEAEPPSPPSSFAVVSVETPRPPARAKRRKPNEARLSAPAPPEPAQPLAPGGSAAPSPPAPATPKYGRWTVAPEPAQAQGAVSGLAACTPLTLTSLAGAAREACAKRLSEQAGSGPAFAPTPDKRKARELEAWEAYNKAVADWKASRSMGPHPCPPQDTPKGKLYLDHCSLVNAARRVTDPRGDHPAVKVEFKVRF